MAGAKIVVLYPPPTDVGAFESAYVDEHMPMMREKLAGMTKFVFTRVLATPGGAAPPYHRITEIHFPSMAALKQTLATPDTQGVAKHAADISSGGAPILLISEEETVSF